MDILKHQDIGWDVALLQLRLDIFATGYLDERTVKAVKTFQKNHKLEVDGQVGPKTHKALELNPVETKTPFHPNKLWMTIALSQVGVIWRRLLVVVGQPEDYGILYGHGLSRPHA